MGYWRYAMRSDRWKQLNAQRPANQQTARVNRSHRKARDIKPTGGTFDLQKLIDYNNNNPLH